MADSGRTPFFGLTTAYNFKLNTLITLVCSVVKCGNGFPSITRCTKPCGNSEIGRNIRLVFTAEGNKGMSVVFMPCACAAAMYSRCIYCFTMWSSVSRGIPGICPPLSTYSTSDGFNWILLSKINEWLMNGWHAIIVWLNYNLAHVDIAKARYVDHKARNGFE